MRRKQWLVLRETFRHELSGVRSYLGYLLGIALVTVKCMRFLQLCDDRAVQMWEPFVVAMTDPAVSRIILLGLLLILVDSPFINAHSIFVVTRSGKKNWYGGTLGYLLFQSFLYYGLLLLVSVLVSFRHSYLMNEWSQILHHQVFFPSTEAFAVLGLDLGLLEGIVAGLTPVSAMASIILLQILYGLLLAMLAFIINMNARWVIGNVTALTVHLLGVIMGGMYSPVWRKLSLFNRTMLTAYSLEAGSLRPILVSCGIMGAGILILGLVGRGILPGMDFVVARGDREW